MIIKTKTFAVAFAAFNLFLIAGFCSASTIFSDNFNSYIDGNLDGQGGWVSAGTGFQVESSIFKEGAKAIGRIGSVSNSIIKEGNTVNDGTITFYIRTTAGGGGDFELWQSPTNQTGGMLIVRISVLSGNRGIYYVDSNINNIKFGDTNADIWYPVQLEWRSSDHKVRYNFNKGAWTNFVAPFRGSTWISGLGGVRIVSWNGGSNEAIYFDTIQEDVINEEKDPVIVVPGILGSAEKDGQWVIDPILHTYDNLIDSFEANGYVEDETLFTFPYDWHKSNIDTAVELKNKIVDIKEICECKKVDIVGHSMGGLVARQYIQSGDYQDDIDQIVFLGTPHLGAPKDYLVWEGAFLGEEFTDRALTRILTNEGKDLGYKDLFDYIRNKPITSVQELLPIYNYLVDSDPLAVRQYPENYPTNSFLEDLNNNISTLNSSGVEIHNIIGDIQDNSTINFIRVVPSEKLPLWEHGYPEGFDENTGDGGLSVGEGDGTVPDESSDIFPDTVSIESNHVKLPTKAQPEIFDALLGEADYTTVDNLNFLNLKLLIIKLLSPVDMQIVAPSGERIGKDFNTGQEINEIQYAFYSGFETDDEYITILNPEEGNYEIIIQGTGDGGEYTISSALISDDDVVEYDFIAHTTTNQTENLDLSLTDDEIIIIPEDIISPEITIHSPQSQDYLHSDVLSINYSAIDSDSGVFSNLAKLDIIEVDNGQNIDLFYQSLGDHKFTVEAKDNVNNQSSVSVNFRIIATIDSTISDINRAYELGWISKESIRDNLIKDINKTSKLVDKIREIEEKIGDNQKAVKKIKILEKRLDKLLAKAILLKLKGFKNRGLINQQAYDVISSDINWLINN